MKKKHTIFLALLMVSLIVSCEIDDDFGEYGSVSFNPAVSYATGATLGDWKDNDNVLFWVYSHQSISALNISSGTIATFYPLPNLNANETFKGLFLYIAPDFLATVNDEYDNITAQYKTNLYITDLTNNQTTRLTENLDLNTYFDIDNPIIKSSSSLLTYAVRNESNSVETWLYDPVSSDVIFVGPGYPVTFSPGGDKLLCHDYSSGTYIYNVIEKNQEAAPFALSYVFNNEVRWNESGVVEGYVLTNYPVNSIQIHNLTTNHLYTRSTTFNTSHIYLSPSGERFIDGSLSCISPYLKTCPGQDSRIAMYMVDIKTNGETELLSDRLYPGEQQQFFIEKLEFSPDESKIAFTQLGTFYISQN